MAGEPHPGDVYEVGRDPDRQGKFKVFTIEGGEPQSRRGLTKTQATKQFRLLEGLARGWEPDGTPSDLVPVPGQGGRKRR
jgi:hypothetical protein